MLYICSSATHLVRAEALSSDSPSRKDKTTLFRFLRNTLTSRDFKNSMFLYMDPISEESVEILFLSDLPSSNASLCFSSSVQAKI